VDKGEIYLGDFPFGDMPARKVRPVLLLTGTVGTGTELIGAYISSIVPKSLLDSDILIDPSEPKFQSTRLKAVSVLRMHKVATIHVTSIKRLLGHINAEVQEEVNLRLREVLQP
jgi:mRNA-degrading endonuclease toxin of MazEF toxin-antitoxin module